MIARDTRCRSLTRVLIPRDVQARRPEDDARTARQCLLPAGALSSSDPSASLASTAPLPPQLPYQQQGAAGYGGAAAEAAAAGYGYRSDDPVFAASEAGFSGGGGDGGSAHGWAPAMTHVGLGLHKGAFGLAVAACLWYVSVADLLETPLRPLHAPPHAGTSGHGHGQHDQRTGPPAASTSSGAGALQEGHPLRHAVSPSPSPPPLRPAGSAGAAELARVNGAGTADWPGGQGGGGGAAPLQPYGGSHGADVLGMTGSGVGRSSGIVGGAAASATEAVGSGQAPLLGPAHPPPSPGQLGGAGGQGA
jgi:hypothetical protein